MSDFNEQDIRQMVITGYQYIKNSPLIVDNANRSHSTLTFPYETSDEKRTQSDAVDLSEKSNELRASTPCISGDWSQVKELTYTDTDFHAAMRRPRLIEKILEAVLEKFSYTKFIEIAKTNEVPLSTSKRWLKKPRNKQLIEKQGNIYTK